MSGLSALRLFADMYADCAGVIELRALPSTSREFVQPAETSAAVARFARAHHAENLYFGVALRRWPEVGLPNRGALIDCVALPGLFVDLDFKAAPVEQAREAVRRFPLKPSAVVRSGGGAHLYWLLREPMELPAEAPRARDLLRRLALHLGGDITSAEPARILRIPGTLNRKYTPPRPVVLAQLDSARRFNPSDFDFLPGEPEARGDGASRFALPEQIRAGERNTTLYALARSLKGRSLGEPEIVVTLNEVNRGRCHPPLDEQEVRAIAHHAATQPDRPNFRHTEGFTVEIL
jgi:hypothetical protein